jgi:hypothetical protein
MHRQLHLLLLLLPGPRQQQEGCSTPQLQGVSPHSQCAQPAALLLEVLLCSQQELDCCAAAATAGAAAAAAVEHLA